MSVGSGSVTVGIGTVNVTVGMSGVWVGVGVNDGVGVAEAV